jgi:hypothetical protein
MHPKQICITLEKGCVSKENRLNNVGRIFLAEYFASMESAISFLTGKIKSDMITEMVSCWFSANPTYVVTTLYLKSRKDQALGMVGNPSAMLLLILRPNEGPMGRKYGEQSPSAALFCWRAEIQSTVLLRDYVFLKWANCQSCMLALESDNIYRVCFKPGNTRFLLLDGTPRDAAEIIEINLLSV